LKLPETANQHVNERFHRGAAICKVHSNADTQYIKYQTPEYKRAAFALFLTGFASFSLIYCVQPLLPEFARQFQVSPAHSSLALSYTTGFLSVAIMLAAAFSQSLGRKSIMLASMTFAAVLNIIAATTTHWQTLLLARAVEGLVLGGVPAVAMAWLAEEIEPDDLGKAMGIYVAGTAFGAMMGRVGMGLMTEYTSWRIALGGLGIICLLCIAGFAALLPPSRNFVSGRGLSIRQHLAIWGSHLRNPNLLRIYGTGFMLTSIFVTLFNYTAFRLSDVPYKFSQTKISMIFLVFGFGIIASSLAGKASDKLGRKPLLVFSFALMIAGIWLTIYPSIYYMIAGIALVTTGFFTGHSVTSSSVAGLARFSKGHATSLYLLFYYMGSSITGSIGGWFWMHGGWSYVSLLTGTIAVSGFLLALSNPDS